jgi:P pilus assembly chaperone PapD
MPPVTRHSKPMRMMKKGATPAGLAAALAAALLGGAFATPASAGLVLSQAVVDIGPAAAAAQDIEVWNDATEVAYVVAQPSEVVAPGQAGEKRVAVDDPGTGGLLVTPQRMILQPGERKLLRVAAVGPRQAADRIWRVTVKPVAGPVTAQVTALKLLVGYDVLVVYRPAVPKPQLVGERSGNQLTIRNAGNTNVELYDGKQCPTPGATACKTLPPRRLYAGASWQQTLPATGGVEYHLAVGSTSSVQSF